MPPLTLGIDYGTASVRAAVFDTATGAQLGSHVFTYPRFAAGKYCDAAAKQFRQHPLDYLEGLEASVVGALDACPPGAREQVVALSVDTTGSTPVAVDATGTPLALREEFADDPEAMFYLWKDHTSIREADDINAHNARHVADGGEDYLRFVGGIYSTEWFWAKLLHALRQRGADTPEARPEHVEWGKTIHSWVEHADWMPFVLTGGTDAAQIKRGVCAAGHKGIFADAWGGFPPADYFRPLDERLAGFADRLPAHAYLAAESAGTLSADWAAKFGLSTDVQVGIGALDAHIGAIGGQTRARYLTKVMGTSTCDMIAVPPEELGDTLVPGISGQVPGSIVPGKIGLEAGQSAFGDVFAWFEQLISWGLDEDAREATLARLGEAAAALPTPTVDDEIAVEWLNGRRSPDADPHVRGAVHGLTLGTDAPRMYRALVEATCFGARAINERFGACGVAIEGIIGVGGVAQRSPFVMQTLADVLGMPIAVHRSEQTCAAGAAMCAATVAGVHASVEEAMAAMGRGFAATYEPDGALRELYDARYARYRALASAIDAGA